MSVSQKLQPKETEIEQYKNPVTRISNSSLTWMKKNRRYILNSNGISIKWVLNIIGSNEFLGGAIIEQEQLAWH